MRPCKAKKSFVVCELPSLGRWDCGSRELLQRTQGAASARRIGREPGSVGRLRGRRRATAGAKVVRSPGRAGTGADGLWRSRDVGATEEPAGAESFGRRDEPEPGPTAGSGIESTWSSSSKRVLRASAGVRRVRRTRSDCRAVGRDRPTVVCVRRAVTHSVI